jgi:hypothetical protein
VKTHPQNLCFVRRQPIIVGGQTARAEKPHDIQKAARLGDLLLPFHRKKHRIFFDIAQGLEAIVGSIFSNAGCELRNRKSEKRSKRLQKATAVA